MYSYLHIPALREKGKMERGPRSFVPGMDGNGQDRLAFTRSMDRSGSGRYMIAGSVSWMW